MLNELSQNQIKILELFKFHIGRYNSISGKRIAERIGLPNRMNGLEGADMRSLIHSLRVAGYPICAGISGYYYAKDKEELADFINSLEKRIKSQKKAKKGLEFALNRVGRVEIQKPSEEEKLKEFSQMVLT